VTRVLEVQGLAALTTAGVSTLWGNRGLDWKRSELTDITVFFAMEVVRSSIPKSTAIHNSNMQGP
jgi:hypothetical protein